MKGTINAMDLDVQQAIDELRTGMVQGFEDFRDGMKELQDGMLEIAKARKADADKLDALTKKVNATPRPTPTPRPQPTKKEPSFLEKLRKELVGP